MSLSKRNALAGYSSLDSVGFIELVGPEATMFLQNLATNDVRPLGVGQGCETFFANHKARAIAHAEIFRHSTESYLISVESERTQALFQHLDRHLISERVEIFPHADWAGLRVFGSTAASRIHGNDAWFSWHGEVQGQKIVRRQGVFLPTGYDVIGPAHSISLVRQDLQTHSLPELSRDELETLRIEAGWPAWGAELDENRFIVETGRIAQAISYAKGCYLGQEPIVMARDRGQVNRTLMGFVASGPVPVGSRIMQGEIERVKVTSSMKCVWSGRQIGLAYVYRGSQTAGATIAFPVDGGEVTATLSSLPLGEM